MNRLLVLASLAWSLFAQPLCATDSSGATAGRWTYDVPAARSLADSTDRPLLVMFGNTSGKCAWCDKFEKEINASKEWKSYANEQQLAMAFINFDGPNWDEAYYQSLSNTNQTDITGFPAFVVYASNGSNVLAAFSFNSTNLTYSAESFVSIINTALEDGSYLLNDKDIWDPADNSAVGAGILNFESFNQHQHHTLNDPSSSTDDLQDWMKFFCVSGRKYKLQIPESDYTISYTPTGSTTLIYTNANYTDWLPTGTSSNSAVYPAVTNWLEASSNRVVITESTNRFDSPESLWLTNGIPFYLQTATNVVILSSFTNIPPAVTPDNTVVYTNLPYGNAKVVTNGSPTDVIVPSFAILDPTAQTTLTLDAGPFGYTNSLPLTALTNGCVFTPFASLNNAYCFIRIHQPQTNTVGTFDTEVYGPAVTNLAIYTAVTNTVTTSVTRELVSNAWLVVTATPTNYFDGIPNVPYLIITTNLISQTLYRTVTNSFRQSISHVTTNLFETTTTNYIHYSYGGTSYALNYRLWEPGEIVFTPTAVSASEGASSVKLTVTRRNGSAGEAKIAYSCADGTAEDGQDYQAATGELTWADDQAGSTNITVNLIQDLHPTWEGDEQFSVTIQKRANAEWFQAKVGADSQAVVTLKESGGTKKAGTLVFSGSGDDNTPFPNPSKPALTVTEGESFTLCVARPGGSNGIASVTISTADGSAKAGTDYTPHTETLWWDDGEWDVKAVSFSTPLDSGAYNPDASFTVKLSGASGAKLGSPASVAVTVRDEAADGGSLSDTAAAAAAVGATFKATSANWFWSDEGRTTLRCEPLAQGGKAVLQLTLTGPGKLSFAWKMNDWEAADTLGCSGGIVLSKTLSGDGDSDSVLVKPGKQTITWTYTKATAGSSEAYASLENLIWSPLPKAATPVPANGARINPETLSWTGSGGSSVNLGGDFEIGDDGLDVTWTAVPLSPTEVPVPDVVSPLAFDDLWNGDGPAYNTTYKWRVDTVFSNDDGTLVNTGDTWAFTAIEASGNTEFPSSGELETGVYAALQGVACDLGAISEAEDGLTYALIGGTLPPGLKLAASTGQISGLPTKTGTWTVTLQATENNDGVRTPFNSATFTITVYPLGAFAGTYTGWTAPVSGGLAYSGSGSATVSAAGDLTAKFNVAGTTYSFSKKGFDGTDAASEPTEVEIETCPGASVTASNGKFVNTLDGLRLEADGTLTAKLTVYALSKSGNGKTTATPTTHDVVLFRNNWADVNMKTLLAAFTGYYTVSLPVSTVRDDSASPLGSGYVTMTVGSSGSVKLSGVLADGNTWSASVPLYLDPAQTNDTETAGKTAEVYVYAAPSSYAKNGGFCGRLRITAGDSLYGNAVDCPDAGGTLQWWNFTPTSVYGATGTTATASSGFLNAVAAAGGYYDTVMNLQTYYLNKTVTFADSSDTPAIDRIPSDYNGRNGSSGYELLTEDDALPFGLALAVGAKSLSYASPSETSNLSDLKLSLARATGLLSGSFLLTYERENADGTAARHTRKVAIKGVHTPVRPRDWADDPSAGVQGGGFYLIPETGAYLNATGKNVSYTFNWSYAFELYSQE